jgi:hypothetical protein
MKTVTFIGTLSCVILLIFTITPCFSQSASDCTVTSKSAGNNLIIVSCPDGSRTVDAGGRTDLYRVGDRVDIYGIPGNQPAPRPGETQMPGR